MNKEDKEEIDNLIMQALILAEIEPTQTNIESMFNYLILLKMNQTASEMSIWKNFTHQKKEKKK